MAEINIGDTVKVIRKDWGNEDLDYRVSYGKTGTVAQAINGAYGVVVDGKLLEFYRDEIEVQMAEMTAREAVKILHKNPKVLSFSERQRIAALLEQQAAEIERLNKSLQYEQHRTGRQGTHAEGCYKWGPGHWDCAMQEIERLAPVITAAREYDTICTEIFASSPPIPGYMLDVARRSRIGLHEALERMAALSASSSAPAGEDAP